MKQKVNQTGITKIVKWAKWPMLLVWLIVLMLTLPFMGKLHNSLSNVNPLPAHDQAEIVHQISQQANPHSTQDDLSVVYENTHGLRTQDVQIISQQRQQIITEHLHAVASVSPVQYAPDKKAAYFTLLANIPSGSKGDDIEKAIVQDVRKNAVSSGSLTATTTGSMAIDIDSNSANADSILLLSAAIIVAILLIFTYRSALLWIIPLISALLSISLADAIVYALTRHGTQVSSLDSSILIVMVFGVATDYGMLLVSRYREYLHTHADKNEAAALALKGSFGAIAASGTTVALALLALVFASLMNTKDLGPVAAIGIVCAFLVQMTFLPAVLAIGGRVLLWPRAPKFDPASEQQEFNGSRLWGYVAGLVSRYPRRITVGVTALLLICAIGLTQLKLTVDPTAVLRGNPPSVQGQAMLARHFSGINSSPLLVTANDTANVERALQIARSNAGTASVSLAGELAGHPSISITPKATPYSNKAFSYIADLRTQYQKAGLQHVNVGGTQAAQYDMSQLDKKNDLLLMPVILLIVGVILVVLLRSIVAPIMLLLTIVCSFACSLGISVVIFQHVLHFQGMDPALPLYIFLFVVALGVDYNIFLMHRAHQEAQRYGVEEGTLRALRVTGGVITAAGLVLAGTFATLALLPIVTLTEVGFAVALGVLIDSFLVRSFLVPAAVLAIGPRVWWPGRLSKRDR